MPEGYRWIDARRTASGQESGQPGRNDEQKGHAAQYRRIRGADVIKLTGEESRQHEGSYDAKKRSSQHPLHAPSQSQPQYLLPSRTQCLTNPDLVDPLVNRVGQDAIDPHQSESESDGDTGEQSQKPQCESRPPR